MKVFFIFKKMITILIVMLSISVQTLAKNEDTLPDEAAQILRSIFFNPSSYDSLEIKDNRHKAEELYAELLTMITGNTLRRGSSRKNINYFVESLKSGYLLTSYLPTIPDTAQNEYSPFKIAILARASSETATEIKDPESMFFSSIMLSEFSIAANTSGMTREDYFRNLIGTLDVNWTQAKRLNYLNSQNHPVFQNTADLFAAVLMSSQKIITKPILEIFVRYKNRLHPTDKYLGRQEMFLIVEALTRVIAGDINFAAAVMASEYMPPIVFRMKTSSLAKELMISIREQYLDITEPKLFAKWWMAVKHQNNTTSKLDFYEKVKEIIYKKGTYPRTFYALQAAIEITGHKGFDPKLYNKLFENSKKLLCGKDVLR